MVINGSEVTDDMTIAEEFNSYFATVAEKLSKDIPFVDQSPLHYINSSLPNSLFLSPVSLSECSSIIADLKLTSGGPMAMPVKMLMEVKHLLIDPICFLINEAFSSGKFPTLLKHAIITPIIKNEDPASVSIYRPISVLHWLSKIFEKAIASRIITFANLNSLFSSCQYGFGSGKSNCACDIEAY